MDGQQGQAEEYVPTGHEDMKTEGKQSKVPAKRTVHHTGTDTEVLDEYYMDGKKGPLDPDHCQRIKMINLWKTVKALTVYNVMKRYSEDKRSPRFLKVAILKNEKENEVIASVYFLTKDDAFKAAKGFSMEANWRWNKGIPPIFDHLRYPKFLCQRVDDVMRDIRPGCVVHLPAGIYFKPNAGAYVEVRFNDEIRGHPVIIVKRHRTDLVNVVLCTTFGGRSLEDVFKNRPEKMREFIEIDSTSGHHIRQVEMTQRLPLKGYADTMVYTTSLESLARLQMECLKDVSGGCLRLYNLGVLLNRTRRVGDDSNAEHFTSGDPDSIRGKLPRRVDGRGILATTV
ncbi:hypothetical protein IFR04_000870 [Cadophora malorum]|uniref:Uncharacterized protein n=1 Tax=Cadophora malorum TaxID=108018 RepID=A0A8H7WJL1_9HELO|nr:hypothetical protein IFR04_000870 [Cadophora malorum]